MKNYLILLLILPIFPLVISAQERSVQIYGFGQGVQEGMVTTHQISQRYKESAKLYGFLGIVDRMVEYDYAFGANSTEHRRLNGYGVLLLSSINQVRAEHPIKRLYFVTSNSEQELQLLFAHEVEIRDELVKETFGEHRVDYYYLIPYSITQQSGFLMVDWSVNRSGFVAIEFPLVADFGYQPAIGLEVPFSQINMSALNDFMQREYGFRIRNW